MQITASVLSMWQPWASAVVWAKKKIENRTYLLSNVSFPFLVFIHATKTGHLLDHAIRMMPNGEEISRLMMSTQNQQSISSLVVSGIDAFFESQQLFSASHGYAPFPLGKIIGTAKIVGQKRVGGNTTSQSVANSRELIGQSLITYDQEKWIQGPCLWFLDDVKPCEPVSWKGKVGFRPNEKETIDIQYYR